jgi:hypothetical protein
MDLATGNSIKELSTTAKQKGAWTVTTGASDLYLTGDSNCSFDVSTP